MKIIRVSLWLPLLTVLGLSDHISAMFHGGDIIHDGQSNSANTDMVHRVTPVRQPTKVVHDVKIRSADKVYLYSKINSCTRPNASVLATCGIDYRVPTTVLFHNILQVKNYLAQMARRNMIVYNSKCASIVTKIKCKTLLPRCSEDYTTVYLNDIQEECNQAAIWCQNATNFPHVNICKQNRSVYSFNQCIKPPLSFDNPSLCNQPMLPSYSTIPQWLLPNLKLSSSRLNENLRLLLSLNGAKNGCIDKTIMTMCQSIPHCSTDGTHLLTTLSESQCEATVKCLPKQSRTVVDVMMSCKVFSNVNVNTTLISTSQFATTIKATTSTISTTLTTVASTAIPSKVANTAVEVITPGVGATNMVSGSYSTSSNGSYSVRSSPIFSFIVAISISILMCHRLL